MPPEREASTKPIAATVFPAPVACSNQKRRAAFGSSGCSGIWTSSSSSPSESPSQDAVSSSPSSASSSSSPSPSSSSSQSSSLSDSSSSTSSSPSSSSSSSSTSAVGADPLREPFDDCSSAISAIIVPDSASTWWAFRTVPSSSLGSSCAIRRSRPSISEYFWRHSSDG